MRYVSWYLKKCVFSAFLKLPDQLRVRSRRRWGRLLQARPTTEKTSLALSACKIIRVMILWLTDRPRAVTVLAVSCRHQLWANMYNLDACNVDSTTDWKNQPTALYSSCDHDLFRHHRVVGWDRCIASEWPRLTASHHTSTNLVQPSLVWTSGTTLPRFVRQSTERQADVAAQRSVDWTASSQGDRRWSWDAWLSDPLLGKDRSGLWLRHSGRDPDIWCRAPDAGNSFIWKLPRILASSARTVHVSAAYRSVERTRALYARILMGIDNRQSRHIFFKDAITEDARRIGLLISDTHWSPEDWTLPMYTKTLHMLHRVAVYSNVRGWVCIRTNIL